MEKMLIWLSGADPHILEQCSRLPQSERIKFAGFGTLVLIPAILAFVSMAYAVSTVSNNPFIFIAAGVVWSLIILVIDRFLVSTFYKSSLKRRRRCIHNITLFVCRIFFAGFVGLAVSHPFMLFYFDQSIKQMLTEKRREAVEALRTKAETAKSHVQTAQPAPYLTIQTDGPRELHEKTARRDCLHNLLTAEQSGYKVELQCGYSSGMPHCANRCQKIQEQIKQLNQEIETLTSTRNRENDHVFTREAAANTLMRQRMKDIDDAAVKDMQDIEAKYSEDYLARVDALTAIEQGKPHIRTVRQFLLIFFVFIDILPIMMKVMTPMGEYEQLRDTLLCETEAMQDAAREVATTDYASIAYKNMLHTKLHYGAKRDELTTLTHMTNQFLKDLENQRGFFAYQMRDIIRSINKEQDDETKRDYITYFNKTRVIFRESCGKSLTLFQEVLEKL
jgi:hypothetical protein